jgi:hypothetical protein
VPQLIALLLQGLNPPPQVFVEVLMLFDRLLGALPGAIDLPQPMALGGCVALLQLGALRAMGRGCSSA